MKKILCVCAAFAMFAVVGCGDTKTTAPAKGAAPASTPASDKPKAS